jgi:Helicase conserved C-terminal domain
MTKADDALPNVLEESARRTEPARMEVRNVDVLRTPARLWLGPEKAKLNKAPLIAALAHALDNDQAAAQVVKTLSEAERTVAAVYRRYGGTANGEVVRLELTARGLLDIEEKKYHTYYSETRYRSNPVKSLVDRWVLLLDAESINDSSYYDYSSRYDNQDPRKPFRRYSLQSRLVDKIAPAGPVKWSIPAAPRVPDEVVRRAPAEVALDLSRVLAFVASKEGVKMRKDGLLALPTLRAFDKAMPDDDSDFIPPDVHALHFEILRSLGAITIEGNSAVVDRAAATRAFERSDPWQAHGWARGWLQTRYWNDGAGVPESFDPLYEVDRLPNARASLAWALGGLARSGHHWYDLNTFIASIIEYQKDLYSIFPRSQRIWEFPQEPAASMRGREEYSGRQWYANALMVTLVTLGLVERGRTGRGDNVRYSFRLTDVGRIVFGAPEVVPAPRPTATPFLVVQPNFDVLAYVNQADAASGALLGRIAEVTTRASGPVQTFRLTQSSVYQGQEGGLEHTRIVDFLERHNQGPLPPNVIRSLTDWSGRRESLVLRSGVRLLGFATTAERDAALKKYPGTPCGTKFILATASTGNKNNPATPLICDHMLPQLRRILTIDEHGAFSLSGQLDVVQRARLARISSNTKEGWRLTKDSTHAALAAGIKPAQLRQWLDAMLAKPAPALILGAIDAWMTKARPLGLDAAVLLYVPDLAQFNAIAMSPRLEPFFLGSPGPHWLLVARDSRAALSAALKELGFTFDPHLPSAAAAVYRPTKSADPLKPAKKGRPKKRRKWG